MSETEQFAAEQFVNAWRSSQSLAEVAKALGITETVASQRAARLRAKGVKLVKFKPGRRGLDVAALNKLIRGK